MVLIFGIGAFYPNIAYQFFVRMAESDQKRYLANPYLYTKGPLIFSYMVMYYFNISFLGLVYFAIDQLRWEALSGFALYLSLGLLAVSLMMTWNHIRLWSYVDDM